MDIQYPAISSIVLDTGVQEGFRDYRVVQSEEQDVLSDLSKVNIFVGSNNSGKSRFMRYLANLVP